MQQRLGSAVESTKDLERPHWCGVVVGQKTSTCSPAVGYNIKKHDVNTITH